MTASGLHFTTPGPNTPLPFSLSCASGLGSRIERLLFSDVDILMAKHHTPFTNPIDCSQKSTIVKVISTKRKNDLPLIPLQILPKTALNPVLKLPLATKGNHLSSKADKGTFQKLLSGFCPLRGGGTPPFR